MRLVSACTALLLISSPAFAGSHTESSTVARIKAELKKQLKEELKNELAEQLREELKAELSADQAMAAAEDESWSDEEWKWEEPVKPTLNFLDFDGYFRFRYDFFHNLDLDTYYKTAIGGEVR